MQDQKRYVRVAQLNGENLLSLLIAIYLFY